MRKTFLLLAFIAPVVALAQVAKTEVDEKKLLNGKRQLSKPLVVDNYSADPSAHVFNGKIYIYPSHDIDAGVKENDNGDHFDMRDYHVYTMDSPTGKIKDLGVALDIKSIPWAGKQLWAPDAAERNGTYYLYFPAKDKEGVFKIGVASAKAPQGPFVAEPEPIKNSLSIDPCVFKDDDGSYYMYFGGIWGGQLQRWRTGSYDAAGTEPARGEAAIGPRVAKLSDLMTEFSGEVKEIKIVDETGASLLTEDNKRRFFEAAWMHKYNGKYYLSYSTGDTHFICYAIGDNPYGPFTYKGVILNPVLGWTNHHSIIDFKGKWYLFYHDSILSGGKTHLRNIKVSELSYDNTGAIKLIEPYID